MTFWMIVWGCFVFSVFDIVLWMASYRRGSKAQPLWVAWIPGSGIWLYASTLNRYLKP